MSEYETFEKWWYAPLYASINGDSLFDKDMFRYKDLGKQSAWRAWQACVISQQQELTQLREALKDYDNVYEAMWQYFQCSEQCTSNESWAKKCSCGADKKSIEVREIINKHKDLIDKINKENERCC